MLKMMANENLEDWGAEFIVTMETVHATVEAFAAGRITLPIPKQMNPNQLRYAPSFASPKHRNRGVDHPYTAQTIARF